MVEAAPNPVAGWASPSAIPPEPQVWALFYVPRSLGLKAPFPTSWEQREFKNILIPWWGDHAGGFKFLGSSVKPQGTAGWHIPSPHLLSWAGPPMGSLLWSPGEHLCLVSGPLFLKVTSSPISTLRGGGRRR